MNDQTLLILLPLCLLLAVVVALSFYESTGFPNVANHSAGSSVVPLTDLAVSSTCDCKLGEIFLIHGDFYSYFHSKSKASIILN